VQTIWRADYLFSPIVVIIVSLVLSILDRSRYKFLLVFTALLPFIAFTLAAGSSRLERYCFRSATAELLLWLRG
jgi:hypothetical protein